MTTAPDLVDRLERVEAFQELWQLVSRYAVALDDRDYPTLQSLFVDDGEFVALDGRVHAGSETIAAYLRHRADTIHRDRLHTPTSQIIDELTTDRATGLVLSYAALFKVGEPDAFFAFRYSDDYQKVGGRWRFKRRRLHTVKDIPRGDAVGAQKV